MIRYSPRAMLKATCVWTRREVGNLAHILVVPLMALALVLIRRPALMVAPVLVLMPVLALALVPVPVPVPVPTRVNAVWRHMPV